MSAAALLDRLGRPGDIRLGSTRPERVARLSTGLAVLDVDVSRTATGVWPRLARAAERTGSALLVVAPRREAGTFAALGLELDARRVRWSGGPGRLVLLEGIDARVTVARSRVGRPGQALGVRQARA